MTATDRLPYYTKVTANDIFRAISQGYSTATEVSTQVSCSRSQVATYLKVMSEIGLIDREVEVVETVPGRAATIYRYTPNHSVARRIGW